MCFPCPLGWSREVFIVPGKDRPVRPSGGGDIAVSIRTKCDVSDDPTTLKNIDYGYWKLGAHALSIAPAVGWIAEAFERSGLSC
jgi:hypothetical protein